MLHRCKSTCFQSCLRTFNEIRVFERVRNALVDILEKGAGNQLLTVITLKGFKVINPTSFKPKALTVLNNHHLAHAFTEVNQLCTGGLDAHNDSECWHSPS